MIGGYGVRAPSISSTSSTSLPPHRFAGGGGMMELSMVVSVVGQTGVAYGHIALRSDQIHSPENGVRHSLSVTDDSPESQSRAAAPRPAASRFPSTCSMGVPLEVPAFPLPGTLFCGLVGQPSAHAH
jgi:hypothetical protein